MSMTKFVKKLVMRKYIVLLLIAAYSFVNAQVAKNAEDISPLLIGEKIPNVELVNIEGQKVKTKEILNKKTVLIVYRGGWCPFCNAQLADLQDYANEIQQLGYQIVAVSPDAVSKELETSEKNKLSYALYSDVNNQFSKELGITFEAPLVYSPFLKKYSEGTNKDVVPVPTVYVLNEEREIEFMYINPNYKIRLKGEMLLAVLKAL